MHLPFLQSTAASRTSQETQRGGIFYVEQGMCRGSLLVVSGHFLTAGLAYIDALHLLLDGRHGEAGLGKVGGLELESQGLVFFAGAPALEPWVGLGGQVVGQVLGHRHA